jgi:hypothetical protein
MRRPCRRRAAGAACDARSHWPSRARPAGDLKRLEWVRTALRRSRQTWCGRRDGAEWLQSAVPDTGVGFMAFTNVMQSAPSALSRRALVARSPRASQPPQPATDGSGAAGIKKGTRSAYGPGLTRPAGTCPGLRRWPTASAGSQREMHTTRSALSVRAYRLTRAKTRHLMAGQLEVTPQARTRRRRPCATRGPRSQRENESASISIHPDPSHQTRPARPSSGLPCGDAEWPVHRLAWCSHAALQLHPPSGLRWRALLATQPRADILCLSEASATSARATLAVWSQQCLSLGGAEIGCFNCFRNQRLYLLSNESIFTSLSRRINIIIRANVNRID